MKRMTRLQWLGLLCLLWVSTVPTPGLVAQQNAPRINKVEIRHVGPPAVSDALIRANIRAKEGDVYSPAIVGEDVKNLYATKYFYNIQVVENETTSGLDLIYVVETNPVITDINIVGNKKFSRSKILKKITSKEGAPLNEPQVFNDQLEIQKMYQKSGLQKTEVKYVLNINRETARATVTFEIQESPKVRIEKVVFEGAQAFPQKKLRKAIKTREHWWLSFLTGSGVLKDEQLEDDKGRLAEFYRDAGYIDFEIRDIKYDYVKEKKLVLRIEVYEGKQYHVGNIEFKGNKLFSSEDISQAVTRSEATDLKVGGIFTPKGLRKYREAIEDFYGAKGYIGEGSASAVPVQPIKNPNTETGTIDLTFQIEEGDKSYIERVQIRGNQKTKDKVIRRELAVSPGEPFDMVKVKKSQDRLRLTQFFDKVEARPEPTDVPNRKDLVIDVAEAPTGDITFGAGFSSVESLVGFVTVTQGNFDLFNPPYFTGGGQKFRLQASLGTRRQDYELTFSEPWFLDRKLILDVNLYHREASYLSDFYNETRTGLQLGLERALMERMHKGIPQRLIGGVSYTFENVGLDVDNSAPRLIRAEDGSRLVSKVGTSLSFDTARDFLKDSAGHLINLPRHGQYSEVRAELGSKALGSDNDTYLIEAKSSWYFPGFFDKHVVEVRGRIGVIDSFGSGGVPFFDRYFLGGAYSLRGFDFRDVGPKIGDVDPGEPIASNLDEPIGGRSSWFGSIEYSLPIVDRLRFALFYDIGNVYFNAYDFNFGKYNDDVGVGLRINITPRMPLRLDYGIPISTDKYNDNSGRFNFSIGFRSRN